VCESLKEKAITDGVGEVVEGLLVAVQTPSLMLPAAKR